MRIGFDVDGVLADFNTSFINRVISVTGRDLFPPRPFAIPTWNYPEFYGYTGEEVSKVWKDIKADPWFWRDLPPYEHTGQMVMLLTALQRQGHEIYYVTARPGIVAKKQTEQWLERQQAGQLLSEPTPTVLISSMKGLCAKALDLNLYVDDRTENVLDVLNHMPNCITVLFEQPWNAVRGQDVLKLGGYVTNRLVRTVGDLVGAFDGKKVAA